jgi:Gpi18-like mannosyltransferase
MRKLLQTKLVRNIILMILVWRVGDILLSLLAQKFIPYIGFFSYGEDMLVYGMPDFIRALTNFDGIFYIRIALKGYSELEQAYFPIYPLLIRYLTPAMGNNPIGAGLVISHTAFFISCAFLYRILKLEGMKAKQMLWFFTFLLAYPTSYYFGVMYTESTFLVFFTGFLYFLRTKQFIPAFLFAYVASLTRVIGIVSTIPAAIILIEEFISQRFRLTLDFLTKNMWYVIVGTATLFGLATYAYYLWVTTGDPLYFFHAQEHFGAHRSTHLILLPQVLYRYVKIFITADYSFQYYVAINEVLFLLFSLSVLLYDLKNQVTAKKRNPFRLGLNLFSLANVIIPTLTGTLTALPRYTLLSLSIFFVLSELRNTKLKVAIVITFIILHAIIFMHYIQGYYVT